ncbi:MAG: HD domain-containing phosphohydrolase [Pirellulales bacterium]
MNTSTQRSARSTQLDSLQPPVSGSSADREALCKLRAWLGIDFHLVDAESGDVLCHAPNQGALDVAMLGALCRVVAERGRAELLDDEEPLLVLAIPLSDATDRRRVAMGVFVSTVEMASEQLLRAIERLGMSPEETANWIARQTRWTPQGLLAMGQMAVERLATDLRVATLEAETQDVSLQLSATYEEISLLHRITQKLKLTSNDRELGELALEWLAEVVPARSLAIYWMSPEVESGQPASGASPLLSLGHCPVDTAGMAELVQRLALKPGQQPLIVNPSTTAQPDWAWPEIHELMVVPLSEGENCFGWLAAFNHIDGGQFGTVEASLLGSVGVLLGIHCGNADLYRQQREMFAGVVRALTSAIDAKDPYTCGHSERVARIAMRLAEELGCDSKQLDTIYFAGLLHDVGKIGINDVVLRKEGKLTEEEYEHIKTHAQIGYKILVDIKRLDDVLPAVLHHHEQWDGRGYPSGMKGEEIPFLARIVGVADAFDAMTSDRPYRKGMPDEKLDAILRDGAGKQWDAGVIDAFFRARDDVRRIARGPAPSLTLDA